ncbi:MAG TPA: hypothetical protein VNQ90_05425 [Chthoniobacteraceae bacterium]|nr:hypothetical protein [Chthoniobacteraceae bacterium]
MSHPTLHQELTADTISPQKTGKFAFLSLAVGIVGLIASFLLAWMGGEEGQKQFAYSWLFAVLYFFSLTVGSLFWVLVHHATDAEWTVVVRRQLENVAVLTPLVGLFFFAGIICFAPLLYSWWTMAPGSDELLDHKSLYLNHTGFYVRAILYFVGLSGLAFLIRRHSVRQDETGASIHTVRSRVLSFAGIPILALSLTFAAVDWIMALEYTWFSTMWGVYIFAGGVGAAMALLVLIVTALKKAGHLKMVNIEHYHVMGKFMLTFCIFWAYIGFSQYMLIWYANIPEETSFFIRRNTESWWYFTLALVIGRFFLPFPILLFQATKKNPKWLCIVAGWMIAMQALDLYVLILPMLHQTGANLAWLDLTNLLAVGGIVAAAFFWILPKSSLFPVKDPRIEHSTHFSN